MKNLSTVEIIGVCSVVALASLGGYISVKNAGINQERSRIVQDFQDQQCTLLHDAEFKYKDTPKQDSLLRDAGSLEYALKRLGGAKK